MENPATNKSSQEEEEQAETEAEADMVTAFERFSIREYARKMRSEDMEKWWPWPWPFLGNEDLCPPLDSPKFRWWKDELKIIKSNISVEKKVRSEEENSKIVCPVCECFEGKTVDVVNKHVNRCLIQASRKEKRKSRSIKAGKLKLPKKRSIVELFTVAQQIDEDEDDDDGDGEEEGVIIREKKKKSKSIKKKKKKMDFFLKKEKSHKLKSTSQCGLWGKPWETSDTVSFKKKKSSGISPKNKQKNVQAIKTIDKCYEEPPWYPIHGILKKQTSVTGDKKNSAVGSPHGGDEADSCHLQQVNKHVHFSGKDCTLEENRQLSPIVYSQIQNIPEKTLGSMFVFSVNEQPETGNNISSGTNVVAETSESGNDAVISALDESRVHSMKEKEQMEAIEFDIVRPAVANPNTRSYQDKGKSPLEESVSLMRDSQHLEGFYPLSQGNSTTIDNSPYASFFGLLNSIPRERLNLNVETQVGGNVEKASDANRSVPMPSSVHVQRSAAMTSLSTINATLDPLTSGLPMITEASRKQHLFLSHASSQNSSLRYQPPHHAAPKDTMANISSSLARKQKEAGVCWDKFKGDDFIGLPLNSHGELVKLRSTARGGLNKLKKQNMPSRFGVTELRDTGRAEALRESSMERQKRSVDYLGLDLNLMNISPSESRPYQIPSETETQRTGSKFHSTQRNMPSRFGVMELQDTGRVEFLRKKSMEGQKHSVNKLGLDLNLLNISTGESHPYEVQSQTERIKRGDNSGSEFHSTPQQTLRLMGKYVTVGRNNIEVQGSDDPNIWAEKQIETEHHPTFVTNPLMRKSKEAAIHSWEPQRNFASPSFLQVEAVDPRNAHPYFNMQARAVPQSIGNCCVEKRYDSYQHMLLDSNHLRSNTLLAHGATSGFQFPFTSLGCRECVQPSWAQPPQPQGSSRNLPHWMLDMKQQKEAPFSYPQSYPATCSRHHQYSVFRSNISVSSSPYCTSMTSYPNHPAISLPPVQSSASMAPLVQRPLIPAPSSFRPKYAVNTKHRRTKLKTKVSFLCSKDNDGAKKTRKRYMEETAGSTGPFTKTNLGMEVVSSTVAGLETRRSNHLTCNRGAPECDPNKGKGRDEEVTRKVGLRTLSAGKSGPVKLRAGAKHILKPSPNSDQYNSKPTHSTIPFTSVTNSGIVSGFQNKSMKIYKL